MLRYPAAWIGLQPGYVLVALVGGMGLLTVLMGRRLHATARQSGLVSTRRGWVRAIVISLLGLLIGAALAFGKALHPRLSVLTIFAGIGGLGVVMGYAFFVQPLGLACNEATSRPMRAP